MNKPKPKPARKTKRSVQDEEFDKEFSNYSPSLNNKEKLLSAYSIKIEPKNKRQRQLLKSIEFNDVTICTGVSGSGKTFLTVAKALELLKNNPDKYDKIILTKSLRQLKEEELGTLPGDAKDKLYYYMLSYMDHFHKLIGESLTEKMMETGLIRLEPFGTLRGRDIDRSILIADEIQNISKNNCKTLLTRISGSSKFILMGDIEQIDMRNTEESCLEHIAKKIETKPEQGVGVIRFLEEDVVRHRLTTYFLNLYK